MAIDFSTINVKLNKLTLYQVEAVMKYLNSNEESDDMPESLYIELRDIELGDRIGLQLVLMNMVAGAQRDQGTDNNR